MLSSLQSLLDQRQLWRARESGDAGAHALASGWPRLDRELYGAGWPMASLSEMFCAEPMLVWQLLQPALVQLSQQQRLLIWIGHQQPPYAPAWQRAGLQLPRCLLVRASEDEAPWAAEQALRLAQGGAVILQADKLSPDRLRRLQLAAQAGNSFGFLLRPLAAQRHTSPAVLRLTVQAADSGLQLAVLKRRGGTATAPFVVPTAATKPVLSTVASLARQREQAGFASAVSGSVVSGSVGAGPVVSVQVNSVSVNSVPAGATTELSAVAVQAAVENVLAPVAQQRESKISVSRSSVSRSSVTLPPRMAASFLTEALQDDHVPLQDASAVMAAAPYLRVNQTGTSHASSNLRKTNPEKPNPESKHPEPTVTPVPKSVMPKSVTPKNVAPKNVAPKPGSICPDKTKTERRKPARQTAMSLQLDLIPASRAPVKNGEDGAAASSNSVIALTRSCALSPGSSSDKAATSPDGGNKSVEHNR